MAQHTAKMEMKRMRQNRFLSLWSGVVLLTVLALCVGVALAGDKARHYQVAVLTPGLAYLPVLEGFQEGLKRLGYVPGENLTVVVEDTHGAVPDLAQRAARLVAAKPDVLVTVTTPHTKAVREMTTNVPIVFAWVGDPLRAGLIDSYASSKNNLTGISVYSGPLSGKRLEILQEIAPGIKRILALVATKDSIAESAFQVLIETAKKLEIQVLRRDVTTREEIEQVLRETPQGSADAIYHVPSSLVGAHIEFLIQKANQEQLPLMVHEDSMVNNGALASYGADFHLVGVQAARLVAKLLNGVHPAEIPIQTPDKLILAVNLTTAKAIGLGIPLSVLERADRLVE
jgi:putative ABC transport system substrate-binding protein